MAFDEIRFNDQMIIYNTSGGASYNTKIVETNGGKEQRNAVWLYPRAHYTFTDRLIMEDEKDYILGFFNARGGRERGFRFKDWADFEDKGSGVFNESGVGNSLATAQMFKRYTSGPISRYRKIVKPVLGTISVKMDGTPKAGTMDYTTGVFTFDPIVKTVTGATAIGTSTYQLTVPGHGFLDADKVYLTLTGGTWSTQNGLHTLSIIDADTISFSGNASTAGTFISGSVSWYPQAANTLTWAGQFDVPVRFDSDEISMEMHSAEVIEYGILGQKAFNFAGISIVEVKL